jgi:hypothetical protein
VFSANRITEIDLQPGCVATTDTHIFAAPANDREREWDMSYTIPAGRLDFTANIDLDRFHEMRMAGESELANIPSFTIDEASKAWLAAQDKASNLIPGTSNHTVINTTIVIIAIVFRMTRKDNNKNTKDNREQQVTMPTLNNFMLAPSAPTVSMICDDDQRNIINRVFNQQKQHITV